MGRKKSWGGAAQIERAEQMFRESGDYKYVALAIGSRPLDPPKWAMLACVKLRLKSEALSALGRNVQHVDAILDTAVWFLAQHQTERFEKCQAIGDPAQRAACKLAIKPMARDRALKKAIRHINPDLMDDKQGRLVSTLDALKKAWDREKKEERFDWDATGPDAGGPTLDGFRLTHRIARVLMQYHASEYPDDSLHFYDPDLLIWFAKQESEI